MANDDYYNRSETQDYGRDYGSGRYGSYSSARSYQAAETGRDRDDRNAYGRDRDQYGQGGYGRGGYGQGSSDRGSHDRGSYDRGGDRQGQGRPYGDRGGSGEYHGSYASDGRRFEDYGRYSRADDDDRGNDRDRGQDRGRGGYGAQPQGYRYEERGFFDRAGDEVRSWFGDEEAERRRDADARRDERESGERYSGRGSRSDDHSDYRSWREQQISALDRDYDEYRQQNRDRFNSEFGAWRTGRQGQRDLLNKVEEHAEVVGSDGEHVGTVDKVRGDRVILTKNDADAGGHHHSFPSSWLQDVADKVTLSRTAAAAKAAWKDEERGAMFGSGSTDRASASSSASARSGADDAGDADLNRSFRGTY